MDERTTESRLAAALRWTGLLIVLAVTVLRLVTAFAHTLVFDVDPAFDPNLFAGAASAGILWLNVVLLLGAGIALLGGHLARRGIDWVLLALAVAPMALVFWHGYADLGDLRTGSSWASAVVAGVTIAQLGRDRVMRIVILAVLAGCAAPLLVRGAANVTYEHAETVELYEQQKELILADKGWQPDSSSARIYERRLMQVQPTGWFATTNIFGSFMAAGAVLWLGLCVASLRARMQSGWAGLCGLIALVCAAGLVLTESKGALLSCMAGLGVLIALLLLVLVPQRPQSATLKRVGSILAVGLVLAALLGIAVRGALLPETFLGEVSLLYRWHYIVAATRIFVEHPLAGVGPDEFQAAYMIHRVATNPEEVAAAHSMFFDWLATLGMAAAAWIAIVFVLLWRGGRDVNQPQQAGMTAQPALDRAVLISVPVIAICAFTPAIWFERPILDVLVLSVRLAGVLGFAGAALIAGRVAARADSAVIRIALLAAAVVLVVHGQIEMTWTQVGSCTAAFVFLGAASSSIARRLRSAGLLLSIVILAGAVWLAITGAVPATSHERGMVAAARMLWPVARARQAQIALLVDPNGPHAGEFRAERDAALDELGVGPAGSIRSYSDLERLVAPSLRERRLAAADLLEEVYDDWPVSEDALYAASNQLGLASREMRFEQRVATLKRATTLAEQSAAQHRDIAAASDAMLMRLKLHELTGEQAHMNRAVELARALVEADPKGVRSFVSLGDMLWRDGQRDAAAEAYRTALQHSANFALDPLKQLSDADRQRLESRISEVEAKQRAMP